MKINFCISGIPATGGVRSIFEYANGLIGRGHEVTITIPYYENKPTWFDLNAELITPKKDSAQPTRQIRQRVISRLSLPKVDHLPESIRDYQQYIDQKTTIEKNLLSLMPECDINIATDFPTALPVYLSKKGIGCYFLQHYERVFADARPFDSVIEGLDADYTYQLPLFKIANSTWVKNVIEEKFHSKLYLCCNGVSLEEFYEMEVPKDDDKIIIVSFSGNGVAWKGFKDAVEAMKIVFDKAKNKNIVWKVYGGEPELTPEQAGVPFDFVGKVYKEVLTGLYNEADIVFLSSWYESFPLPPIEAMACGKPVVTTQYGTEDYAIDGETALVVPPRKPEMLAEAILKLIYDPQKRKLIADNGKTFINRFTWQTSVENMEKILLDIFGCVKSGESSPYIQGSGFIL